MNEISILKNECLEWKNWKTSKIMGLSHIGGRKEMRGVYNKWVAKSLQASMHCYTPTPTRAQGGCQLWIS